MDFLVNSARFGANLSGNELFLSEKSEKMGIGPKMGSGEMGSD
jgi:hypothetical protein